MKRCKTIDRECKKHGVTEHVQETSGYFRCKRCRNDHVIQYRKDVKARLVKEFGGTCKLCGYARCVANMIFHHRDPSIKEFEIGNKGGTLSYEKLRQEAEKCVLLCCRCHGEVHAGLVSIPL